MRPFIVTSAHTINLDLVTSWVWGHRSFQQHTRDNRKVLRVYCGSESVTAELGEEAGKLFVEEIEAMVVQERLR